MKSRLQLDLQKDVQFFEYSKAADPINRGTITAVPFAELLSHLHEKGPTRVIPFDLGDKLVCDSPATSPNLSAAFVRIEPGKQIRTAVNATSELFYVIRGSGVTLRNELSIEWKAGDFFVVPGGSELTHPYSLGDVWAASQGFRATTAPSQLGCARPDSQLQTWLLHIGLPTYWSRRTID